MDSLEDNVAKKTQRLAKCWVFCAPFFTWLPNEGIIGICGCNLSGLMLH